MYSIGLNICFYIEKENLTFIYLLFILLLYFFIEPKREFNLDIK